MFAPGLAEARNARRGDCDILDGDTDAIGNVSVSTIAAFHGDADR